MQEKAGPGLLVAVVACRTNQMKSPDIERIARRDLSRPRRVSDRSRTVEIWSDRDF